MSFDEGSNADFNHDDFKARLKSAMRAEGITFEALCERGGVSPSRALRVIEYSASNLYENLDILEALARATGRDLNWLITGVSSDTAFSVTVRERSHQLVSEYIYRAEVPQTEREGLHQAVDALVNSLQTHTPQAAYRRGLPQTWKDVAWIHRRMNTRQTK